MNDAISLTLLVCVAAVGLGNLAVRGPQKEHDAAVLAVYVLALPMALVSLGTAALLVLAARASRRLRRVNVPDHVPHNWAQQA